MFCFLRSNKKAHRGWTGLGARLTFEHTTLCEAAFSIVRQNDAGEVLFSPAHEETDAIARVEKLSAAFGTRLRVEGDRVYVSGAA
jgi:hypothetical protein